MKPEKNSRIDMVDNMPPIKKRVSSSEGSMDALPDDVIGLILSHMDGARDLAVASCTCRKWHQASMHHLQSLTFVESEFAGMALYKQEIIITKAVMKTSCLHELSISMDKRVELQPATVIAWLLHTKKTLKSLTFRNRTKPMLNILEYMGADVEELNWRFAYIPTIISTAHRFKSLVWLKLMLVVQLTAENLKALLIACPKMEYLCLKFVSILEDGTGLLELQSSSMTTLDICGGLNGTNTLVLHAERLEEVHLEDLDLELLKLVQGPGNSALRHLSINVSHITQLDFGEAANSLLEMAICTTRDLKAEWLKYYEVVSKASNLKKLELRGLSLVMRNSIDMRKIAIAFPHLYSLSLEYESAWECFTSHDSGLFPVLEKVAFLELYCYRIKEGFLPWIAGFLEHSPSLKGLEIHVNDATASFGRYERTLSKFTSSMAQLMRSYPRVDVNFDFGG